MSHRELRLVSKAELKRIKQEVAKRRKRGEEVYTDDELDFQGYCTELPPEIADGGRSGMPPKASQQSSSSNSIAMLVPHVEQQEDWDCGLACVGMVLSALGLPLEATTQPRLRMRLSSSEVWTIDLAYLLSDFGVDAEYCTATWGPDVAGYSSSSFYAKSLHEDAARVRRLFGAARAEGVAVSKRTLGATELWNLLIDGESMLMALVDVRKLYPERYAGSRPGSRPPSNHNSPAAQRRAANGGGGSRPGSRNGHGRNGRAAAPAAAPEYSGHYVLLVGVDEAEGGFLIRDPARAEETDGTVVSVEALHAARRAHGTDEDLVIIPLDQRGDPRPPPSGTMPKVLRVLSEQWDSAAATTRPTSAERSTRGRLGQFSHSVPSDLSQMSLSSSSHPRALGLPQPSYRTSGRTERTSRVSERSCESDSD